MQLNKNAFDVVFIAVVGLVCSPRVVSTLHNSNGDGVGGRDGLEMKHKLRVSNYSKKTQRDGYIFSRRSFFLWLHSVALYCLVLSVVLVRLLV